MSFGTPSHARDQGHRLVEQGYVSSITDERLANGRTIFTVTLYSGTVYKWSPHQLECFALGTRVSRAGSDQVLPGRTYVGGDSLRRLDGTIIAPDDIDWPWPEP